MNHAGDNIGDCVEFGQDVNGGWLELAELCSSTKGCVAVNAYVDPDTSNYTYCLKTSGTDLTDDSDMFQACLGILVKV